MTQMTLTPSFGTARSAGTSPLRLTRRGCNLLVRVPLVVAGVATICGLGAVLTQPAEAGTESGDVHKVTVMQGDTLWDIARSSDPQRNAGDVVEEIRDLNDFSGPLHPGQSIVVPNAE